MLGVFGYKASELPALSLAVVNAYIVGLHKYRHIFMPIVALSEGLSTDQKGIGTLPGSRVDKAKKRGLIP